jgi:hypothetical protein
MLKRIRNYFVKDTQPDCSLKNKLRFESIHSDKRFDSLQNIYKRLLSHDQSLADSEILINYSHFSKKIQTNTFAAAELELASISVLCYFRPGLTDILIRNGLLAIVYSLGENIDFDDVVNFVQHRILAVSAEPYGGWPQEEGIKWLSEILPESRDSVKKILIDVIKKNKEELDSM